MLCMCLSLSYFPSLSHTHTDKFCGHWFVINATSSWPSEAALTCLRLPNVGQPIGLNAPMHSDCDYHCDSDCDCDGECGCECWQRWVLFRFNFINYLCNLWSCLPGCAWVCVLPHMCKTLQQGFPFAPNRIRQHCLSVCSLTGSRKVCRKFGETAAGHSDKRLRETELDSEWRASNSNRK